MIIVFVILAITLAVFIGFKIFQNQIRSKAETEKKKRNQPEFVSNQILVKFREEGLAKVQSEQPGVRGLGEISFSAAETGIEKLNQTNQKFKATKIDKVVQNQTRDKIDQNLDSWYVINLDVPKKNIKGDLSQTVLEANTQEQITYEEILNTYRRTEGVETAELNHIFRPSMVPNDYFWTTSEYFGDHQDLWNMKKISAEQAWDKTTGNGVVVAVVDTGVDYNHPDLRDNILKVGGNVVGYDFANNDTDPMDDHSHGTHVAGIIAAKANNDPNHSIDSGTRLVGVGPNLKIMPIKGITAGGYGIETNLLNGIKWAADHGAKVINNSWGGSGAESQFAKDIIKYAHDLGTVVVFASGNEGFFIHTTTPAGDVNAITVGASNYQDGVASFSNFGAGLDLLSPGGDSEDWGGPFDDAILSASYLAGGKNYLAMAGTSMAAPHISAAAGLLFSLHPDWSPEEIRFALKNTADTLNGGWNQKTGSGRLNINQALNLTTAQPVAKFDLPETAFFVKTINGTVFSRIGINRWSLSLAPVQAVEQPISDWITIASGISAVNGKLADIDPSRYNGSYLLKLEVVDVNNQVSQTYNHAYFNNQMASGWPQINNNAPLFNNTYPAIGDINGDGNNEVVITNYAAPDFSNYDPQVVAYRSDGSILTGFPKRFANFAGDELTITSSPTLVDLNSDGKMEILFSNNLQGSNFGQSRVFAIDGNGNDLSGWPIDFFADRAGMPIIVDINNDSVKEIVFQGSEGHIFVYKTNGQPLAGWPATAPSAIAGNGLVLGDMAVANIDTDNQLEIVATFQNNVYAYKSSGQIIPGWPKSIHGTSIDDRSNLYSLNIADVNNDNQMEIIFKTVKNTEDSTGCGDAYNRCPRNIFAWDTHGNLLWDKIASQRSNYINNAGVAFIKNNLGKITNSIGPNYFPTLVLSHSGSSTTLLDNWPGTLTIGPGYSVTQEKYLYLDNPFGDMAIGDVNNDGNPELVFSDMETDFGMPLITATDINGQNMIKFGQNVFIHQAPALGDIDGDSKLEIVANGEIGYGDGVSATFVWETDSVVPQNSVVWGQYRADAARSATYRPPTATSILRLAADKVSVSPQGEITYTINFNNSLAVEMRNSIISAVIPSGTTFVSAENGGVMANGNVLWPAQNLSPNGNFTTQYKVRKN